MKIEYEYEYVKLSSFWLLLVNIILNDILNENKVIDKNETVVVIYIVNESDNAADLKYSNKQYEIK